MKDNITLIKIEISVLVHGFECVTLITILQHTWHNIFGDNLYMFVSVRPCVFVPESYDMTKLMDHNTKFITVFTNRDCLFSVTSFTNKRTTPK